MITLTKKTLAIAGITVLFFASAGCTSPVSAEDGPASVNGIAVSQDVFDLYATTRIRKPAAELTDEEKESVISELQDIYLLADLAKKQKLDRKPEVMAQMSLQQRSVLAQALVNNYIEQNPATDEELAAEYATVTGGAQAQQYKARHILLESEADARSVIGELDGGADFAELAKSRSTGPSGPQGGDLGWFSSDSMVKPFSDAVVAMENGSYSKEPVQTQFGWHVILREESKANVPPPLDQVRDQLKPVVEQKKFQEYLEQQRGLAKMTP